MIMEQGGYNAEITFDPEIDMFMGKVINARDVITFYGASVADLKREFGVSLEVYFQVCRERGIAPEKPFSGKFIVRIAPNLHAQMTAAAAKRGVSLNSFAEAALERETKETLTA